MKRSIVVLGFALFLISLARLPGIAHASGPVTGEWRRVYWCNGIDVSPVLYSPQQSYWFIPGGGSYDPSKFYGTTVTIYNPAIFSGPDDLNCMQGYGNIPGIGVLDSSSVQPVPPQPAPTPISPPPPPSGGVPTPIIQNNPIEGLMVVQGLSLSSTSALTGQLVTASMTVRNTGSIAISVPRMVASARGPNADTLGWNGQNVDFPAVTNLYLAPGQEYSYQQSRSFDTPGTFFAEPTRMAPDGGWGGVYPFPRVWFNVVTTQSPNLPPPPDGETWMTTAEYNAVHDELVASINEWDQALSIQQCLTDLALDEGKDKVIEKVGTLAVSKGFGSVASTIVGNAQSLLFGTRDDTIHNRSLFQDRLQIMEWRYELKDLSGNYIFRNGDYVRMPYGYRELPLASFSLFWAFWSDWTCWISPEQSTTQSLTTEAPGIVPSSPTLAPAYPPGVYVTAISPQPTQPGRNQGVPFAITFLNTTSTPQTYNLVVQVFSSDTQKGFGETVVQSITVPVGTSQITSPNNWGVRGPGGCVSLFARAYFQNADHSRTPFLMPDGSTPTVYFSVC